MSNCSRQSQRRPRVWPWYGGRLLGQDLLDGVDVVEQPAVPQLPLQLAPLVLAHLLVRPTVYREQRVVHLTKRFPPPALQLGLSSSSKLYNTIAGESSGERRNNDQRPTCCPWASCAAPSFSWPDVEGLPASPLSQGTQHAFLFSSHQPQLVSDFFALA